MTSAAAWKAKLLARLRDDDLRDAPLVAGCRPEDLFIAAYREPGDDAEALGHAVNQALLELTTATGASFAPQGRAAVHRLLELTERAAVREAAFAVLALVISRRLRSEPGLDGRPLEALGLRALAKVAPRISTELKEAWVERLADPELAAAAFALLAVEAPERAAEALPAVVATLGERLTSEALAVVVAPHLPAGNASRRRFLGLLAGRLAPASAEAIERCLGILPEPYRREAVDLARLVAWKRNLEAHVLWQLQGGPRPEVGVTDDAFGPAGRPLALDAVYADPTLPVAYRAWFLAKHHALAAFIQQGAGRRPVTLERWVAAREAARQILWDDDAWAPSIELRWLLVQAARAGLTRKYLAAGCARLAAGVSPGAPGEPEACFVRLCDLVTTWSPERGRRASGVGKGGGHA